MYKSKKFSYGYDECHTKGFSFDDDGETKGKSVKTLGEDILHDKDFPELEELIIGDWGDTWEDSIQPFLDFMVDHAEEFSHIKSLFIGDMEYDECEVSWIIEGNYEKLLHTFSNLEKLTIKGSNDLELGKISHENLKSLTIICGGLPSDVIKSIETAYLPNLEELYLYLGVEDYGFDGSIDDIRSLLANSDFPKLTSLGILDSEIQDEVTEVVLESKYIHTIKKLDLSCGTLSDQGGQLLLEKLPSLPNLEFVDVSWHYMSVEMMEKLSKLEITINMDDQQEADDYDGEIWCYPMLTE